MYQQYRVLANKHKPYYLTKSLNLTHPAETQQNGHPFKVLFCDMTIAILLSQLPFENNICLSSAGTHLHITM